MTIASATQPAPRPLSRGAVVLATFPRMMGKLRPGVVLLVDRAVIATPLTTSSRGRGTRLPTSLLSGDGASPSLGATKKSFALPLMTAVLPTTLIQAVVGAAPEAFVEEIERHLIDAFGVRWAHVNPPIHKPNGKPRLLHRVKRKRF